jgi:hypothetical protein
MKTNIEIKGLYARAAAILGIAAAVCFPVTSAYAQAPEIDAIYYGNPNQAYLQVSGLNFGSTTGAIQIHGVAFPVAAWTPTLVSVVAPECLGGNDGSESPCLGQGTSHLVKLTTSTGQITTLTWATVDTKLASTVSSCCLMITNVKINGGTSTAHVAPEATFTISGNYYIVDNSCPTCIDAVVVGLDTGATPSCLFHGIEGPAPGRTAAGETTLTAPTAKGIYKILGSVGQNGCNSWDYGVPPNAAAIGAIAVF